MGTLAKRLVGMLGWGIPALFWTGTFVGGWLHGDYNHLTGTVSELGRAGTSSAGFMAGGEGILAGLGLLFVVALHRVCRDGAVSPLPAWLLLSFSAGTAGVAVYPIPEPPHAVVGNLMAVWLFSPLLAWWLWRRHVPGIGLAAAVSLGISLLIFVRFVPTANLLYAGLIQRFFHLGWSVWFIALGRLLTHVYC